MANTTIQIGTYVLPASQRYSYQRMPQYAEFTSLNGLIWRDQRTTEPVYIFSLGWEALTPAERLLVDAAWRVILNATLANHTPFRGLTSAPYVIVPDEKSNDYNCTLYQGATTGTGFTTLTDASLIFCAQRIYV